MKAILTWFKMQAQNLMAWLVAHPIVKNFLIWAVKMEVTAGATYIANALNPAQASTFTLAGLSAAVTLTFHQILQHAEDVFVIGNQPATPQAALAVKRAAAVPPDVSPSDQGGSPMKKISMFLALFLLAASSAMAWNLPANELGLRYSSPSELRLSTSDVPVGGENVIASLPYVDAQYQFAAPHVAGDEGIGFFYAVGLFNVTPATDGNVNVSPLLFVGAGGSAYFGNAMSDNFKAGIPVDFGLELGVPTIQGLGSFTVGYDIPNKLFTVGTTAPLDAVGGALIHVFGIF